MNRMVKTVMLILAGGIFLVLDLRAQNQTVSGNLTVDDNIYGDQSVSIGGNNVTTEGGNTLELGYSNSATGDDSVAMGWTNTASNTFTFALGLYTTASGYASVSLNYMTLASGEFSLSTGSATLASGANSAAFNSSTSATASNSSAFGLSSLANSYEELVLGQYNVGGTSATTWVSTDPLFEIGNGSGSTAEADAFVVYKNGNATVQGVLTVSPGGEIPMYVP